MPELTETSKHVMIEETKEGLNVEIVDQDGRSMFPEGSKEPYERTRKVIQKIAAPLQRDPAIGSRNRPHIELRLPARPGLRRHGNFRPIAPMSCAGSSRRKGCQRLISSSRRQGRYRCRCFPTIPTIAANRRVTITLMREEPPLPLGFKP